MGDDELVDLDKIWPEQNVFKAIYSVSLPSRPIVKKNTQRIVGLGRGRRAIYSKQFTQWEKTAAIIMLQSKVFHSTQPFPFKAPLEARFRFYFKNFQAEADLSNLIEGPQDLLTKCGVISDDKIIRKILALKFFNEEPRTEIELFLL